MDEVHVVLISFFICIFDNYVCKFVGFILVRGTNVMTFISMQRRSTIFETRSPRHMSRWFIIWLRRSNWAIRRTVIANWPRKYFWFLVISLILFYHVFCFSTSVLHLIIWWVSELPLASLEVSCSFIVLRKFVLRKIHPCKILALVLKMVIFDCFIRKLKLIRMLSNFFKIIAISGTCIRITLKRNQIVLALQH